MTRRGCWSPLLTSRASRSWLWQRRIDCASTTSTSSGSRRPPRKYVCSSAQRSHVRTWRGSRVLQVELVECPADRGSADTE